MGLIVYTEKKLSDPLEFEKKKKDLEDIYENTRKGVLRLLVECKSPFILKVIDEHGKVVAGNSSNQSWTHLCLFESDLVVPEKFTKQRISENYMEWLGKFNFGKWMLSDVDNFLKGNPLFLGVEGAKKFDQEVFKSSSLDPSISSNLREND